MNDPFRSAAREEAGERLLDGMRLQRDRLLEVRAAMRDGALSPAEVRSYLGLVRDNLAAVRKTVYAPLGAGDAAAQLIAPMEHIRNRLFDLLAGMRRGELSDGNAADYLLLLGGALAGVHKAALRLR